jgi:hypothetical protein
MILRMARNTLIIKYLYAVSRSPVEYRAKARKTSASNDNRTLLAALRSVENLCSANDLRIDLRRV